MSTIIRLRMLTVQLNGMLTVLLNGTNVLAETDWSWLRYAGVEKWRSF